MKTPLGSLRAYKGRRYKLNLKLNHKLNHSKCVCVCVTLCVCLSLFLLSLGSCDSVPRQRQVPSAPMFARLSPHSRHAQSIWERSMQPHLRKVFGKGILSLAILFYKKKWKVVGKVAWCISKKKIVDQDDWCLRGTCHATFIIFRVNWYCFFRCSPLHYCWLRIRFFSLTFEALMYSVTFYWSNLVVGDSRLN